MEQLAATVRALRVGLGAAPDSDVGPLIRPSQVHELESQLRDALALGARTVVGAERGLPDRGDFFPPTVLVDVTPAMRVVREETFGPIIPVTRVSDADDAVRQANESSFGLSASVWSRDLRRAQEVARRLDAGTVVINDAIVAAGVAEVPHGGVKESGYGRSHGRAGLLECVRTKTVITDRLPGVRQPWWFGYSAEHARNLDAFLRFWHGTSLAERVGGLWRSLRMLFVHERPL